MALSPSLQEPKPFLRAHYVFGYPSYNDSECFRNDEEGMLTN